MTRLPRISGREVVSALRKGGFEVARIKGSHPAETIGPGLLAAILRDCELERDEFIALL